MQKIERLKKEAIAACKNRGHRMGFWSDSSRSAYCECKICHRYVQVIEKPWPNEIEIGGSAVALNCEE